MEITQDLFNVGVNDHEIDLFEGQYDVPLGMSYNSYIILDKKIAVMDTVDAHFGAQWLSNIQKVLGDLQPDYLIIQHMEPDHSGSIDLFLKQYPNTTLVGNATTFRMLDQFFDIDASIQRLFVKNGESLDLGNHNLTFVFAPMVHWPEVMVTFDASNGVLFSADAFGKFGANDIESSWDDEARRYYIGIVGKYGPQVQTLLKKAATLDIQMIAPLHGPVLQEDLAHCLHLYDLWSSYKPEAKGVVIAYTSVYGNTKAAALYLEECLKEKGMTVVSYDLARSDMAQVVADAFKYDQLVLASPTYNGDVFPYMKDFIHHLLERNFQNRTVAFIQNGSWAPLATKVMQTMLQNSKNLTIATNHITIQSALKEASKNQIIALADELASNIVSE